MQRSFAMNNTNLILNTDSYKFSQYNQYPEGTEYVHSYIESRGGRWDKTVFTSAVATPLGSGSTWRFRSLALAPNRLVRRKH